MFVVEERALCLFDRLGQGWRSADMLCITLSSISSPFLSRFTGYPSQKDSSFDRNTGIFRRFARDDLLPA